MKAKAETNKTEDKKMKKKEILKTAVAVALLVVVLGTFTYLFLDKFGVFDPKYDEYVVWVTTNDGNKVWGTYTIKIPEGKPLKVNEFGKSWLVMGEGKYDMVVMSVSDGYIQVYNFDTNEWNYLQNICTTDIKVDGFVKVED